ncbi:MAG: aminotransferase class III-fold pyridoxal phosphate-dependent enzyme [Akkermansia sp.]
MTQLTLTVPYNDREAVKKAFELHGSDIAAVILEPFPANAGLYFPQNDFLHFLREITLRHDALLIFDEVMTGFRVAPGGVRTLRHHAGPYLHGKVIGGGPPVGFLEAVRKSWTASLRSAPCTRREPCPAIRSPWRRDWPSSGNS